MEKQKEHSAICIIKEEILFIKLIWWTEDEINSPHIVRIEVLQRCLHYLFTSHMWMVHRERRCWYNIFTNWEPSEVALEQPIRIWFSKSFMIIQLRIEILAKWGWLTASACIIDAEAKIIISQNSVMSLLFINIFALILKELNTSSLVWKNHSVKLAK